MDELDCISTLRCSDKDIKPSDVFNEILLKVDKYSIDYNEPVCRIDKIESGKLTSVHLSTSAQIDENVKSGGIYFILSEDEKNILYVGKSRQLKNRLKQHLIECPASTNSHIYDTYNYLLQQVEAKHQAKIKYCVINTTDHSKNAAIEGILLDYIEKHRNDEMFKYCWNSRND